MESDTIKLGFERDGFVFPIDVMSPAEAKRIRAAIEHAEKSYTDYPEFAAGFHAHGNFLLPELDELTRMEPILDAVSRVLGDNILVWGCTSFIKEPRTSNFISWHQDLTYWGIDKAEEVTVWVALSPATEESGCMRYVPGSHRQSIVAHEDTYGEENLLTRGQEIAVKVDEASAVSVILKPGQMSMHHGHMFHASGPNRSNDRRIGFAIQYISTRMSQIDGGMLPVVLVRGEDRFGNYELVRPSNQPMSDDGRAAVRRASKIMERYLYAGADQVGRREEHRVRR